MKGMNVKKNMLRRRMLSMRNQGEELEELGQVSDSEPFFSRLDTCVEDDKLRPEEAGFLRGYAEDEWETKAYRKRFVTKR